MKQGEFIKKVLSGLPMQIAQIEERAKKLAMGKTVRILSNFNGQPFGLSKPALTGQTFVVKEVSIGSQGVAFWDGNEDHCFIEMEEIEFLK